MSVILFLWGLTSILAALLPSGPSLTALLAGTSPSPSAGVTNMS